MASGKPLMVAETASAEIGGIKAEWILDAYNYQIPYVFPAIRAVIWFNESKETDWRIESSQPTRAAFASAIASGVYTSNQFASLNAMPVVALA
jgi:hypothetical protein